MFKKTVEKLNCKLNKYGFYRLLRAENRKHLLRQSRRNAMIVFIGVTLFLCFSGIAFSFGLFADSGRNPTKIDPMVLELMLNDARDGLTAEEEKDTSLYEPQQLTVHENEMENYRRTIAVLEELKKTDWDEDNVPTVLLPTASLQAPGAISYTHRALFSTNVIAVLMLLLAVFAAISASQVFGSEYTDKTIKLMLTKPASRIALFNAKLLVTLKDTLLQCLIAFAILLFMVYAICGLDGLTTLCYLDGVRFISPARRLLNVFVCLLLPVLFYTLLAVCFAVSGKSKVLPILGVVLFSRLTSLPTFTELMQQVAHSSTALYNCVFAAHLDLYRYCDYSQIAVTGTDFSLSCIVIIVYVALLAASSALCFVKQKAMR